MTIIGRGRHRIHGSPQRGECGDTPGSPGILPSGYQGSATSSPARTTTRQVVRILPPRHNRASYSPAPIAIRRSRPSSRSPLTRAQMTPCRPTSWTTSRSETSIPPGSVTRTLPAATIGSWISRGIPPARISLMPRWAPLIRATTTAVSSQNGGLPPPDQRAAPGIREWTRSRYAYPLAWDQQSWSLPVSPNPVSTEPGEGHLRRGQEMTAGPPFPLRRLVPTAHAFGDSSIEPNDIAPGDDQRKIWPE